MQERLISELKNFFDFNQEISLAELKKDKKVQTIKGLNTLIARLEKSEENPKVLAEDLELVIVHLKIKKMDAKITKLEENLLNLLVDIQKNPEPMATRSFGM
jgi:uncharacterized protein (UPF0335 family)